MANNRNPATPHTRKSAGSTDALAGQVEGIRVRSLPDTFRRAGIAFTREGIELALDDLSQEQLSAIEDEPLLSVQYVNIAAAESDAGAKDSANTEDDA